MSDGRDERAERFARWVASPASVVVVVPLLVIGVGVAVLLLGQRATRESAESMARRQLIAQASQVQRDVAVTLDQADPVLATMRLVANATIATPDAMQRLHDLVVGRPGIANIAIAFPTGALWSTFYDAPTGELRTGDRSAEGSRTNWSYAGGQHVAGVEPSPYDARTRPHYTAAVAAKHRVWMPPHAFSTSHKTGITVTEPIYSADGALVAVDTIDYNVDELSAAIGRPPLDDATTLVFTRDGTILAVPAVAIPKAAIEQQRLLGYRDFHDPALDALFAALPALPPSDGQQFVRLEASDGAYLASIAAVGGKRANTAAPIDWELATLVPERVLLGATRRLGKQAIAASAAALLIAVGVAIIFAWNLLRMRRAVGIARAEAKSANARADELGSYRLVAKLGAGGMGEVWRAEHQLLARQAAIKLVRRDAIANPAHAALVHERFRREAQTLATLRSRHTIELYDYGVTDDGSFFFVMELLEGLDLAQLVRVHGPQPAARVIQLLVQACGSLAEAHDAGLLHRDIKPANLFVCRFGDEVDIVKLLDFGIAHNLADPSLPLAIVAPAPIATTGERLTELGSVVGTPGYIPPEQATGGSLDHRGDLYALGCVAWWLLAAAEVYPDASGDDLIRIHVTDPLPALRAAVRGWLPEELERIVTACLAKRPEDRPHDARALAAMLAAIAIPDEHAWTHAQAIAWWQSLRAPGTSTPEAATAAAPAPKLTRAAPAATVAERPRSR
ncbi:MAG TPA: protein kinase [Kofleriaceae bacterium]|jgi:serine/threonine protein kinase|nr:protein kinase [Kofleriaceae bacterium]